MTTTEPRETSGATTSLLLSYVRSRAGQAAVEQVVRLSGVGFSAAELEDASTWVSYDTRIRLYRATVDVLGDPDAVYRAAATSLEHGTHAGVVLGLRALGSPRQVYRHLPRGVARFTTTSQVRVTTHPTSATVRMRMLDGYPPSALDCDFARGLFSVTPEMFGLPPAVVTHDRCQADGAPECVHHLTWERRRFGRRPALDRSVEVSALQAQLAALHDATSDVALGGDLDTVLRRLMDRAAGAVLASAYLVAAELPDATGTMVTHSRGLPPGRGDELVQALLRGADLGPTAVVIDIATEHRTHGWMVVLTADRGPADDYERSLLRAYARHAAVGLELLAAVQDSRREAARATALLHLARDLSAAPDAATVAERAAGAVLDVVGSDGGSLLVWEPSQGALVPSRSAGLTAEQDETFLSVRLHAEDVPELVDLLTRHGPVELDVATASPEVERLMAAVDAVAVVAVPLMAGQTLMGVLTASWASAIRPAARHEALARIQGVGDLTATALQNALLLATVRHQSLHDALTGLPNRVLFARGLDEALRAMGPDSSAAVLFCDVDRFKGINDRLGHAAGDELLRQVAARLRGELRPQDAVGRLSGDEFAVRLVDADERTAEAVARRVVDALDQPFRIDGREVRITVSVGVAVHQGTDGRGERLLAAADRAMYEAKDRGRNQVAVAGEVGGGRVVPSLEAELSRAAGAGQLRLYYQPVMDVRGATEDVVGAEALLRWAHPRLGLLAPAAFLPLAEEAGLVSGLDLWAVRAACTALAGWSAAGGPPMRVAVNLASSTLLHPELLPTVRAALTENGVSADQLHLELVESRSLVDLPGVIEHLVELRRLGVRISLDDFGTGYSTLTWLQSLPIDQIKIDRSFIMRLPEDSASVAVVRGVMALARELGIEVIAEGVEEPEQLEMLRELGCSMAQGYLLGRPAPALASASDLVGSTPPDGGA